MTDQPLRHSGDDYAVALAGLFPTGPAWPRDPDSELMQLVAGLAQIFGDVDGRAADLLETETDPRFAYELLPDWERAFGLPDPCVPVVQSLPERRQALVNKLTTAGGQSRAFFTAIATALCYKVEIREYWPSQFGFSSFGGKRGRYQPPTVRFYWRVRVLGGRTTRARFGVSRFGDSLLDIRRAEDLECIFRRWKPAHTAVLFDYLPVDPTPEIVRAEFGVSRFGNDPLSKTVTS